MKKELMKKLHLADAHLDTPFSGLDAARAKTRREEIKETFGRALALAKIEKTDAVFIAGDLFDGARAGAATLGFIREQLAALRPIPVFLCAGNHDPLEPNSPYLTETWPENVKIFGPKIERVSLDGCDVYGVSFARDFQRDSLLSGFEVKNKHKINVMLMHGELAGSGVSSDYNPVYAKDVEKSGLHYLALGHGHAFSAQTIGRTAAVSPGCPEGRGFDEPGRKGAVLAEITKDGADVKFTPLSKRAYFAVEVDATGVLDYETLREKIRECGALWTDAVKATLTGETLLEILPSALAEGLDYFQVKIENLTRAPVDYAGLANDYTLKGKFAAKLLAALETASGAERVEIEKALRYGLAALDGERVVVNAD
jgi:DNA repair exonuclease SbcCD nuclease subunit